MSHVANKTGAVQQAPVTDPSARRPGETEREYQLRLMLLSRDLQYSAMKQRFEWTAILAGALAIAATILGLRRGR